MTPAKISGPGVEQQTIAAPLSSVLDPRALNSQTYQVGEVIASGGMGAILGAQDLRIEREVAMKVIRPDRSSAQVVGRFVEEAKVTGQLEHPNIVPVHDLGMDAQGRVFYTMKLVKGTDLSTVLEELEKGQGLERWTLNELLNVFTKVCDAVAFAHSKGVIHRDLKPSNIRLGEFGEVLVMDWGLAKRLGAAASAPALDAKASPVSQSAVHTMDGAVMGTPVYMSPEQAAGQGALVDQRSDIYALGTILYSILTLRPPVEAKTVVQILQQVKKGQVRPPVEWNHRRRFAHCPSGRIPEGLSAVTMRALSADPAKRYREVAELRKEVTAWQSGYATSAERASSWKLICLAIKRRKREWALGAAAAVALLVVSVLFMMGLVKKEQRAVAGETRALNTLNELKATAPAFYEKAIALREEGKFEEALRNAHYAATLAGEEPRYLMLNADLLQSMLRFKEAKDAYERVLMAVPGDVLALRNAELCQALLQTNPKAGERLTPESYERLYSALQEQKRYREALAVYVFVSRDLAERKKKVDQANDLARPYNERLREYNDRNPQKRLRVECDVETREFHADFFGKGLKDLTVIAGIPLSRINLQHEKVSDLSPLRGMPLKSLNISYTKVVDLRPLEGMPLQHLAMSNTQIANLGPLQGMPMKFFGARNCNQLRDFSPLKGLPIANLHIDKVNSLEFLRGMPLQKLEFSCDKVVDLEILRGAPLRELAVGASVKDLRPLEGMKLERLEVGNKGTLDLSVLRGMPLKRLHIEGRLENVDVLGTLPLEIVWLGQTPPMDFGFLKHLRLRELFIESKHFTNAGLLEHMPLQWLSMKDCGVTNLRPLLKVRELKYLAIPRTTTDITFLKELPNLKYLSTRVQFKGAADESETAEEFWKTYKPPKP